MATNSIIEKVTGTDSSSNRIASTFYCTCSTAAATAQKDATPSDSCVFNDSCLLTGVTVHVKFTNSNTHATPTLKVGTATAKQIMKYGTTKPGTTATASWQAGSVISFTYDGTYWQMNDHLDDSCVTQTNTTASGNYRLLLSGTATGDTESTTVNKTSTLYYDPSTKQLFCGTFSSQFADGNFQTGIVWARDYVSTYTGANRHWQVIDSEGNSDTLIAIDLDNVVTIGDTLASAIKTLNSWKLAISDNGVMNTNKTITIPADIWAIANEFNIVVTIKKSTSYSGTFTFNVPKDRFGWVDPTMNTPSNNLTGSYYYSSSYQGCFGLKMDHTDHYLQWIAEWSTIKYSSTSTGSWPWEVYVYYR